MWLKIGVEVFLLFYADASTYPDSGLGISSSDPGLVTDILIGFPILLYLSIMRWPEYLSVSALLRLTWIV